MNNNNRPSITLAASQKNFLRFSVYNFSKPFTKNPQKNYSYLNILEKVPNKLKTLSKAEHNYNSLPFFNRSFDKKRLKLLFSWYYANKGEYAAFSLIETLQKVGFTYAMQAGISLGVDDLKVPPTKGFVLTEAVELLKTTKASVESGSVTPLEEFQQFVDTWHRTSENLKTSVVQNFTKNVNNRSVLKSLGESTSFSKTLRNSFIKTAKDKNNLVKNDLIGLDMSSRQKNGLRPSVYGPSAWTEGRRPKASAYGMGLWPKDAPSGHKALRPPTGAQAEGLSPWIGLRPAVYGVFTKHAKGRAAPWADGPSVLPAFSPLPSRHEEEPKGTKGGKLEQQKAQAQRRPSGAQVSSYGNTLNPVYMMAFSGARGNLSQVRQLVGMRGLMADPQGQLVEFPIQSNFREGLTVTEYMISCYGARKGLVDTALRTAAAGYLTRRLVDVSHHQIVRSVTCGTKKGIGLPSHLNSSDPAGRTFGKAKNTGPFSLRGQSREVNLPSAWKVTPTRLEPSIGSEGPHSTGGPSALGSLASVTDVEGPPALPALPGTSGRQATGANNSKDPRTTTNLQKPLTLCIGRVLARDIPGLAFRNQEIDFSLGSSPMLRKIYETTGVYVRSPLTCQSEAGICQLCYGWSVSANRLVGLGEAVGIIAAQSIGEPGTQLTMRTFHTGGVFSGDIMEECRAKHAGVVYFEGAYLGLLVRTAGGAIAFCIKTPGILHIKSFSEQTAYTLSPNSLLFVRQGERVDNGGLLAQIPNLPEIEETTGEATKTIVSTLSGEVRQVPTVNSELANIRVLAGQKLPNQNFFYLKTSNRSVSQTKQEHKKINDNTIGKRGVKIIPGVHRWATQSLYNFKQNSFLDLQLNPKITPNPLKTQTLDKLRFLNSLNIVAPYRRRRSSSRLTGVKRDQAVGFCETPPRLESKAVGLSVYTNGRRPTTSRGSQRGVSQKPHNNQNRKSTGSFSNKTLLTIRSNFLKTVINALPNPILYGVFYSPKYNKNWTRIETIPSNNVYKKFRPLWLTSRTNFVRKIKGTPVGNAVVSGLDPIYLYYQKVSLNNSIQKSLNVLQMGLINCNLWWPVSQFEMYEILESELNPFSTLLMGASSTCRVTEADMPSASPPALRSRQAKGPKAEGLKAEGSNSFKPVKDFLCDPIKLQLVFYLVNFLELQNYGYLFWKLSAIKCIKYYADFEKFKTQTVPTVDSELTVQKSKKLTRYLSVQWWGYEPHPRLEDSPITPLARRLWEATKNQSLGSSELRFAPVASLVGSEAQHGPSDDRRSQPKEHTGPWLAPKEFGPLDVLRDTPKGPVGVLSNLKGFGSLGPTTTTANPAALTFGPNLLGVPRNPLTTTLDRWSRPLWSKAPRTSSADPWDHDFWVRPFETPVRAQFDKKIEKPFYKSNPIDLVDSNVKSGEICPIQGSTSINDFKKNNYCVLESLAKPRDSALVKVGLLRALGPNFKNTINSGTRAAGVAPWAKRLPGERLAPSRTSIAPGPSALGPWAYLLSKAGGPWALATQAGGLAPLGQRPKALAKGVGVRPKGPRLRLQPKVTPLATPLWGTGQRPKPMEWAYGPKTPLLAPLGHGTKPKDAPLGHRPGKSGENNISSRFRQLKNSFDTKEVYFRKNLLTHIDRISYKLLLQKRSVNEKKPYPFGPQIGRFIGIGDELIDNYGSTCCGQIIEKSTSTLTLRLTQNFLYSNLRFRPARLSQGVQDGNWLSKGSSLVTLPYISSVTGDIVAGIPKIEQLFEARGTALEETVDKLWNSYQLAFVPKSKAVRECFKEIGLFVVAAIQNVYSSQGVHIADKHLEVITRQMTKRALITDSGDTEFLPDEFVDLHIIECVNWSTFGADASYCPRLIGITKASLTSNSFLSSASFQQTARVLEKEAFLEKTDRLLGLKERVMMGALINAGTGGFQTDVLLSSNVGRNTKSFSPSFFKKLNFFSGSKIDQFKEKE